MSSILHYETGDTLAQDVMVVTLQAMQASHKLRDGKIASNPAQFKLRDFVLIDLADFDEDDFGPMTDELSAQIYAAVDALDTEGHVTRLGKYWVPTSKGSVDAWELWNISGR